MMIQIPTWLYISLGRAQCFFGSHHWHELDEEEAVKRLPKGVTIQGSYCCRCHKVDITDIQVDEEARKHLPNGSEQTPP